MPFSISLGEPFTVEGMAGLHSYAHGHARVDGEKWVFMTGRRNGLHGFIGFFENETNLEDNFPIDGAADRIWVVDIEKRQSWSCGLEGLPTGIAEQLRSTNTQFLQVDDKLYIVGGYGHSESADTSGKMTTFDAMTVVDVPGLIGAVLAGESTADHFRQIRDPGLKVTGGGLERLGDSFHLMFGNSFDGLYSPSSTAPGTIFQQEYTEAVRVFEVREDPLRIVDLRSYPEHPPADPTRPFHRRDGGIGPAISPEGRPRIGIYGGVFRPGLFEVYFEPIYIDRIEGGQLTPGIDKGFTQLLNQYECPLLPIYYARTGDMFTTFFGGMSSFWYDQATGELVKDAVGIVDGEFIDGVPFVDDIYTLLHRRDRSSSGYILPINMPGYLGAVGHLLLDPAVPRHENGVIRLEALEGPTVVGYIFGGIGSTIPYGTDAKRGGRTWASDLFIEVVVTPGDWEVRTVPQPKTKSELGARNGEQATDARTSTR